VAGAFYSESSIMGNVIVAPNYDGDESKLDLELLYKAIVTNPVKVTKLFQP
jgi:ABC-2 type transport system ATP-binding protein